MRSSRPRNGIAASRRSHDCEHLALRLREALLPRTHSLRATLISDAHAVIPASRARRRYRRRVCRSRVADVAAGDRRLDPCARRGAVRGEAVVRGRARADQDHVRVADRARGAERARGSAVARNCGAAGARDCARAAAAQRPRRARLRRRRSSPSQPEAPADAPPAPPVAPSRFDLESARHAAAVAVVEQSARDSMLLQPSVLDSPLPQSPRAPAPKKPSIFDHQASSGRGLMQPGQAENRVRSSGSACGATRSAAAVSDSSAYRFACRKGSSRRAAFSRTRSRST